MMVSCIDSRLWSVACSMNLTSALRLESEGNGAPSGGDPGYCLQTRIRTGLFKKACRALGYGAQAGVAYCYRSMYTTRLSFLLGDPQEAPVCMEGIHRVRSLCLRRLGLFKTRGILASGSTACFDDFKNLPSPCS